MRILDMFYSTFLNKCPRCHTGDVFTEKNPYALTKIFSMHERCSHCELKYEREPSFFTAPCMFLMRLLPVGSSFGTHCF